LRPTGTAADTTEARARHLPRCVDIAESGCPGGGARFVRSFSVHRVVALIIVVHGLTGCLRPSLVECGELACAPAQVCHEGRCLDEDQLEQCVPPATDGTNCEVRGANGHCRAGVCEVATCGDGVL